jgi:hypothetical protein
MGQNGAQEVGQFSVAATGAVPNALDGKKRHRPHAVDERRQEHIAGNAGGKVQVDERYYRVLTTLPSVGFGSFAAGARPNIVEPRHHLISKLDLERPQAAV